MEDLKSKSKEELIRDLESNALYVSKYTSGFKAKRIGTNSAGFQAAQEEIEEIKKELHRRSMTMSDMRFIIWDPKDGDPRRAEGGAFISDGIIGRVSIDNVYISTYASYPDDAKKVADLEVGERIQGVKFGLSGGSGIYDVYRVK